MLKESIKLRFQNITIYEQLLKIVDIFMNPFLLEALKLHAIYIYLCIVTIQENNQSLGAFR